MFNPPSPSIPTENQVIRPVLPPQGTKPKAKNPTPTFLGLQAPTSSGGSGGKTLLGQ